MPQSWAPRCCFEQHQKRMKHSRIIVEVQGTITQDEMHTYAHVYAHTHTLVFSQMTQTKMAYIFQYSKDQNNWSEIWPWRQHSRTVHLLELLLFTVRAVVSFVKMKMCKYSHARRKMQRGHFVFFLHARVQSQLVHMFKNVLVWCCLPLHTVHHLLNIVDPIYWIVYFLPSWRKF